MTPHCACPVYSSETAAQIKVLVEELAWVTQQEGPSGDPQILVLLEKIWREWKRS